MAQTNSLARLWTYVWQLWQLPGTKKIVSLIAVLIAMYVGWRRYQAGRRRGQPQRLPAGGAAGAAGAGVGAAAPGGAAVGAAVGGPSAANAAAALRRVAAISTDSVAGRVTKYLGAHGGAVPVPAAQQRLTVVIGARVFLSGVHAHNSDGLSEAVDIAPAPYRAQVLQIVQALSARCNVYVLTKVPTNPSALEERVIAALDRAGLFAAGLIKPHNVLFCSSGAGKSAMIRHITPHLVVDDEYDVVDKLRPYVDDVLHISACDAAAPAAAAAASAASSVAAPNFTATGGSKASGTVGRAASLMHYFGVTAVAAPA